MNTSKKKYSYKEALLKIGNFCAYQERCHKEVRSKLYTYGLSKTEVEEIIYDLIQNNFVNEERFAKAFVRGKFLYKKWGRVRIKRELLLRDISTYCINKGLQEIEDLQYQSTLDALINKKSAEYSGLSDYDLKGKVAKFCIGKGFESDLVWKSLNG